MSRANRIVERVLGNKTTLVYAVTFDLEGADSSQYQGIKKDLEKAGYTRDSNIGEDSLPKNFYAGVKTAYYKSDFESLIEQETGIFKETVKKIIEINGLGNLERLFVLVSDYNRTGIKIKPD